MKKRYTTVGWLSITLIALIYIFASSKYLSQSIKNRIGVHSRPTLKASLQNEFRLLNSTLLDVSSSDPSFLRTASCVLIATSQPNYTYTAQWINRCRSSHIPYIHFTTGKLSSWPSSPKMLPPTYGRIFALIAASKTLPNVQSFVYTDIDTALNFTKACALNTHPIAISWKPPAEEPYEVVLRTCWFVFNPSASLSNIKNSGLFAPMRLLEAWRKPPPNTRLQLQTVFNELYRDEKWVRENIALYTLQKVIKGVEIGHCGSYMSAEQRRACMESSYSTN